MSGTVQTSVEMANLALAHLKESPITAFDFSSVASRWFKSHYDAYRDAYLAMHDWDFAIELANLAAETTTPAFRWTYQSIKPSDCLRIPQQTVDGDPDGQIVKFEVIGQRIMYDETPPFHFRYVKRITRETEFSAPFVSGFALYLASGCAHVITGKNSRAKELRDAANEAFEQAGKFDAMQGTPLPMVDLDIITGR